MKKKFDFLPFLLLLASIAAAIISAAARCVLTVTALNTRYGVYAHGNIFPSIYHVALTAVIVAVILIAFLKAPHRERDYVRPHSDLTVFTSCVCAFILLADAFFSLYYIVTDKSLLSTFDILEIVFAILSAAYFLGLAHSQKGGSTALAFISLFPIAWCAVCLIRIYFDNSVLQVSPNKIMGEVALLSAMIYFLSESRAQLRNINHKMYLAGAAVAPILLFSSALPNLIYPEFLSIGSSDSTVRYVVSVALAMFIWARLYAYAKKPSDEED